MYWKRLEVDSRIVLGKIKRLSWFWKYVVLKRPLNLRVTIMTRFNSPYDAPLFIESFDVKELNIDKKLLYRYEESWVDHLDTEEAYDRGR